MASATAKLRDVLCAVFIVCTLMISFPAESTTCGICNDLYLSCISGGGSSSSCDRQMRSCQSACYGGDTKSSEGGGVFGTLILVLVIGLAVYFYLDSRLSQKKKEKEIEEEKERRLKMTPEEIAKEQEEIEIRIKVAETSRLREQVLPKLQIMTVDEISEFTKSSRKGTTSWLTRHGYVCKDYDGKKKRDDYLTRLESEKQKT